MAAAYTTALANITPDIAFSNYTVNGTVEFSQSSAADDLMIVINVSGLPPNSVHGMNIHGSHFVNGNCTTAGAHFNPLNVNHGGPSDDATKRHYGDLGNFKSDSKGVVKVKVTDKLLSFFAGNNSLTGSFVIHRDEDDLGLGGQNDSLKTGHTGPRVACGNIVIASNFAQSSTLSTMASKTASVTSSSSTATTLPASTSIPSTPYAPTTDTTSTSYSRGNAIYSSALGALSVYSQILATFVVFASIC